MISTIVSYMLFMREWKTMFVVLFEMAGRSSKINA